MSADATGNFILTGDNALLLTAFALAFSPVSPFLSPRSRLSGCLFPAHVREKTGYYLDEETTGKARFLLALLFRKRRGTTLSLCRTFTRRRRISLFFGQSPKNFRTFSLFTITYNFSFLAPLSFSRYAFAEQKRIVTKIAWRYFVG